MREKLRERSKYVVLLTLKLGALNLQPTIDLRYENKVLVVPLFISLRPMTLKLKINCQPRSEKKKKGMKEAWISLIVLSPFLSSSLFRTLSSSFSELPCRVPSI